MSIYIIDASVAAKWFIVEEFSETALAFLFKQDRLHAPDFFLLEMDNIFCKWIRRGIITGADGGEIRSTLRRLSIQLYPHENLQDLAYSIANQTGRVLYDCLYVALAILLDGRMVTGDRRLYDGLADGPLGEYIAWIEDITRDNDHGR